ncbi:MAG TPA: hypothetical protein PLE77_04415 [Kiritimatiellia bacterium]|nr:hypothetical protein [Kiritimatiellia bacterium]
MQQNALWRFINSPIVILSLTILALAVLLPWQQQRMARQSIRSSSQELLITARKWSSDTNTAPIKLIVESFTSQVVDGFRSAFNQFGEDKALEIRDFERCVRLISVANTRTTAASASYKESIVGVILNGSDTAICDIKINVMCFDNANRLIDTETKWLDDIKVLSPGQTVGFKIDRELGEFQSPKEALQSNKATRVEAQVVDFSIVKPDKDEN